MALDVGLREGSEEPMQTKLDKQLGEQLGIEEREGLDVDVDVIDDWKDRRYSYPKDY